MFKLASTASILAIGLTSSTALASPVVFDYGDLFENGTTEGTVSGVLANGTNFTSNAGFEAAFQSHSWTQTDPMTSISVTVTGTAINDSDDSDIYIYGDSESSSKPAGFGAIQLDEPEVPGTFLAGVGTIQEADDGSDDNARLGEVVILSTNRVIDLDLSLLELVDADHDPLDLFTVTDNSNVQVQVNDGGWNDIDELGAIVLNGTKFEFRIDPDEQGADDNKQFYISAVSATPIPLPAAAWMGISVLSGLGITKKLRNRKANA